MGVGVGAPPGKKQANNISHWFVAQRKALGRFMPSSGAVREIAAVDGLRALAIVLVVWHHLYTRAASRQLSTGPELLGVIANFGFSGVDLFFVLSGFLLFLPFARAILSGAPFPSTTQFYYRRALRILPLYLFAVATLLIFQRAELLHGGHVVPLLLTVLLLQDTTHASMILVQQVNIVFWTLAVEWQFYLVLPWLARGIRTFVGRASGRRLFRRFAIALGALIVFGLGTRVVYAIAHYQFGLYPVDAPHGIGIILAIISGVQGKYIETFALGMGLSVIYIVAVERRQLSRRIADLYGSGAFLAALAGLAACVYWYHWAPKESGHDANSWIFGTLGPWWLVLGAWVVSVCFALLAFAVLMGPWILHWMFSLAPLRYIGIISYSIYVWHLPIVGSIGSTVPYQFPMGYLSLSTKVWVAVLIYCSVSYVVIERPFLSLRRAAHSQSEVRLAKQAVIDERAVPMPLPASAPVS
jgi:peptidoglycan/LPS O-acetylase OafA/YrhL